MPYLGQQSRSSFVFQKMRIKILYIGLYSRVLCKDIITTRVSRPLLSWIRISMDYRTKHIYFIMLHRRLYSQLSLDVLMGMREMITNSAQHDIRDLYLLHALNIIDECHTEEFPP